MVPVWDPDLNKVHKIVFYKNNQGSLNTGYLTGGREECTCVESEDFGYTWIATTLPHDPIFQLKTVWPHPNQTAQGHPRGHTHLPSVSTSWSSQHWRWQAQARLLRPCVTTEQRALCAQEEHWLLDLEPRCQPTAKIRPRLCWPTNIQKGDRQRKASAQGNKPTRPGCKEHFLNGAPAPTSPEKERKPDTLLGNRGSNSPKRSVLGLVNQTVGETFHLSSNLIHTLYANYIHLTT